MKKYLPSGAEMDIIPNETGGVDITIIGPNRSFNSQEEAQSVIYSDTLEMYVALEEEGIIDGSILENKIPTKDHRDKAESSKLTEPPASNLQSVEGLDGKTKWVRPQTQQTAASDEVYTWDTSPNHKPPAPPPITTYGVTLPNSDETSEKIMSSQNISYQFAANPIFPQSSTHVSQGLHPEMVKSGETLNDFQIANIAFPERNESVEVLIEAQIGKEGIGPAKNWRINSEPAGEENPNIELISQKSSTFDIGIISYNRTVTEKKIYQEFQMYNSATGKYEPSVMWTLVREEKTYKYGGLEAGAVEETRDVYVEGIADELLISQYRLGVGFSKGKDPIKFSKNTKLGIGVTVQFNTPWINNPIPKQENEKTPTIDIEF
jgi:hypothetical protein